MSAIGKVGLWMVVGVVTGFAALMAPPARAQTQGRDGSVYCASNDGRTARCRVPWRDAQMSQQLSSARCVRGQSWGSDPYSVWVSNGCRGNFLPARGGSGGGHDRPGSGPGPWQPGPGWNRPIQLQCESPGNRYQLCQVDVGRHGSVQLLRQVSNARCEQGRSWGWNRAGVWVDRGCRGVFRVDRRW